MLLALKKVSLQWIGIYNLAGVIFTALYVVFFENFSIKESIFAISTTFIGFSFFILSNANNTLRISVELHMLLFFMTLFFTTVSIVHWKNLISDIPPIVIIANQESIVLLLSFLITLSTISQKEIRNIVKVKFKPVLVMSLVVLGAFTSS